MILRQTAALFLDAYRELSARKLFWLVLILSGLVVAVFAAVGLNERGVQILLPGWTVPSPVINTNLIAPQLFYKFVFASIGVPYWLGWIACILALVSTASIFPEFVAGGSIELLLSKPIGRLRLFLTKFLTGLLFVALQVGVFTLACFLVIGLRGSSWVPQLFWSIPLVCAMFSYLFCVCALLGLITRSTIASLMLTLLFWFAIFGVHATETILLHVRESNGVNVELKRSALESVAAKAAKAAGGPQAGAPGDARPNGEAPETTTAGGDNPEAAAGEGAEAPANADLDKAQRELDEAEASHRTMAAWHQGFFIAKSVMPKTAETVALLRRQLLNDAQLGLFLNDRMPPESQDPGRRTPTAVRERILREREAEKRAEAIVNSRSTGWVVGTSLVFEGLVLAFAAWLFGRRDF